jgi:hypothetical protein
MNISDVLSAVLAAAKSGSWMYLVAAVLMGAVWATRTYLADKVPFLKTDAGGAATALAMSFFGAMVTALGAAVTGGSVSWGALGVIALASLKVAVAAMGGWSGLRKILLPLTRWVLGKFGIKNPIAVAEAAGAAAVKASPAPGAGSVKDVP